ncbi:hypothetical protein [Planococcus dechangensis]|uniref:Lipoprotein n=1 Tax=Planococcus dechangensis TaxID=1176255 RepID=A0ABV9MAU4_9BACL
MKKVFLLFAILFLLSGCISGEKHQYSGSSDNWSMDYEVVVANSGSQQVRGSITYTGADPSPKMIDYSMGTILRSQSATGIPVTDGVVSLDRDGCLNCGTIQEYTPIQVEIIWDGQTETFTLKEE